MTKLRLLRERRSQLAQLVVTGAENIAMPGITAIRLRTWGKIDDQIKALEADEAITPLAAPTDPQPVLAPGTRIRYIPTGEEGMVMDRSDDHQNWDRTKVSIVTKNFANAELTKWNQLSDQSQERLKQIVQKQHRALQDGRADTVQQILEQHLAVGPKFCGGCAYEGEIEPHQAELIVDALFPTDKSEDL